jgi:carboxyl-terminal processing protease
MNSKYQSDLIRKSVLYDFALSYTDNNRKKLLENYPNIVAFRKNFKVTDELFEELIAYGEKKGVARDSAGLATSGKLLRVQLSALFARDLWNTDAYWQVINEVNPFYTKALEALKDNTFEKMKIATR